MFTPFADPLPVFPPRPYALLGLLFPCNRDPCAISILLVESLRDSIRARVTTQSPIAVPLQVSPSTNRPHATDQEASDDRRPDGHHQRDPNCPLGPRPRNHAAAFMFISPLFLRPSIWS